MGRPRKPTHLKVIAGTQRKDRVNPDEPEVSGEWPKAPVLLSKRSAELFEETCAAMDSMGTLSAEYSDAIAHYAMALEEIEINTGILEDSGSPTYVTHTQTNEKMIRPHPSVAMRSDAMKRAQMLRAELGLGPASKSKVSAGKKRETNRFKALRA